jgi:predicted unusual protein kinase regulating ubiquinone biosynthesis (AarF/ABC1/UbiB family)
MIYLIVESCCKIVRLGPGRLGARRWTVQLCLQDANSSRLGLWQTLLCAVCCTTGNILVRMLDAATGCVVDVAPPAAARGQAPAAAEETSGALPPPATAPSRRLLRPQLVLLDYGLAEELPPSVRYHFISFLGAIAAGDGERAAAHILRWGASQECPDPPAFVAAMRALFAERCDVHAPGGIDLDAVMKAVLRAACVHRVTIDSR